MSAAIDAARFRQVLGHVPTGVTVVTGIAPDGAPVGIAIGSFTSVSLDPALVGFFIGRSSSSWPRIAAGRSFCVNILAEDQEDVCRVFASKADDKFAGLGWRPAGSGSPLLGGVHAWIDCDIAGTYDTGDHLLVLGAVRELELGTGTGGPLVFYRGGYGRLAI
jgi:flavin reductase (DIM6/NTAB) family NADH-FMN oxidoreductase RutF